MAFVFVFIGLFTIELATLYPAAADLARAYFLGGHEADITAVNTITSAVSDYLERFHRLPQDLDTLQNTAGYEYVREQRRPNITYSVANNLVDGTWLFSRAIVYRLPPETDQAHYLTGTTNACGGTAFDANGDFCFAHADDGKVIETKNRFAAWIVQGRQSMQRTMHKFSGFQQKFGDFPSKDSSGADLAVGKAYSFAAIAGAPSTPDRCSGVYNIQGVPLDCADLYSPLTSAPIVYSFEGNTVLTLICRTGIYNASGNEVNLIQEFRYAET